MDRQLEFCKWYKSRLYKCLSQDNLFAELAFCVIGIELMLRQNEVTLLTWDQIDLENKIIRDVQISKKVNSSQNTGYGDLKMTDNICVALTVYQSNCVNTTGKLFPVANRGIYYSTIKKSIGDTTFNGTRLRQIGVTLKAGESQ